MRSGGAGPRGPVAQMEEDKAMSSEWTRFKVWEGVSRGEFEDSSWQDRNAITRLPQLKAALDGMVSSHVTQEIEAGLGKTGMSIRLNPYMMCLIDWSNAETDPIRRQFLPMHCEQEDDHPCLEVDSLAEREHSRSRASCTGIRTRCCFS